MDMVDVVLVALVYEVCAISVACKLKSKVFGLLAELFPALLIFAWFVSRL